MSVRDKQAVGGRCTCCYLVCGLCRITCFTGCRRAFPCCFARPLPPRPEHSIICVGLTGAGKSTLLAVLAGEPTSEAVEPTMGFSMKTVLREKAVFHIKELGGAESIQPYWSKYYAGHEAIIFVIDSSSNGLGVKVAMEKCLSDPALCDTPLLLVCNKQDLADSKKPVQLVYELDLGHICGGREYEVVGSSHHNATDLRAALDRLAYSIHLHSGYISKPPVLQPNP